MKYNSGRTDKTVGTVRGGKFQEEVGKFPERCPNRARMIDSKNTLGYLERI